MSYPGIIDEHPYELREKEHIEYHQGEHVFEPGCNFCIVEKCPECKGEGMTKDCKEVCKPCGGRGRII